MATCVSMRYLQQYAIWLVFMCDVIDGLVGGVSARGVANAMLSDFSLLAAAPNDDVKTPATKTSKNMVSGSTSYVGYIHIIMS